MHHMTSHDLDILIIMIMVAGLSTASAEVVGELIHCING